ncbi:MAG: hypothetical protein IPL35_05690 [Sphingobacteriales bacterium]|nr:hypothetical protein [Sphingobacteriales bacterium]
MKKHYSSYRSYSVQKTVVVSALEYLSVIFAAFLLLWYFFKGILFSPNTYLFSYGGDGIKNYFTPAYYIKYGEGFLFKVCIIRILNMLFLRIINPLLRGVAFHSNLFFH